MYFWHAGQRIESLGAGRYLLSGLLGKGGMAEVWRGYDTKQCREVAIKCLSPHLVDQETLNRFVKEAGQLVTWQHPHILKIYDHMRMEQLDAQQLLFYIVMEYAPGGDLQHRLIPGKPYPLSATVTLMHHVCQGLAYAHHRGVIHRDLKPANILFLRPPREPEVAVLSDFGVAVQASMSHHTFAQAGTWAYMAPEQFQGQAQFSSDIFALGVLFYQLCTGTLPFRRRLQDLSVDSPRDRQPVFPSSVNPLLPKALDEVILTALEPHPAHRYPSAEAFWRAIAFAIHAERRRAHRTGGPPLPDARRQAPLSLQRAQHAPQPQSPRRKASAPLLPRRYFLGLCAGAATIVGGTTALLLLHPRGRGSGATPTSGSHASAVSSPTTPQHVLSSPQAQPVRALAWSPDGTAIVSAGDAVRVWEITTGQQRASTPLQGVQSVAWSPNGGRIAAGGLDTTVHEWDARTSTTARTHTSSNPVTAVAWSPDSTRIAAGYASSPDNPGGYLEVWPSLPHATGGFICVGHTASVTTVAWSPNGEWIASGSLDGRILLWRATSGAVGLRYEQHAGEPIHALAWSPDSTGIVSVGTTVRVWDTTTGHDRYTFAGHTNTVLAVSWSPNGEWIASGGLDTSIQVFAAASGQSLARSTEHSQAILALAWSPDNTRLASGSEDTMIRLWPLPAPT